MLQSIKEQETQEKKQTTIFSKRERDILDIAQTGKLSSKEIAKILRISDRTVDFHKANILWKTDTRKMTDALLKTGRWIINNNSNY